MLKESNKIWEHKRKELMNEYISKIIAAADNEVTTILDMYSDLEFLLDGVFVIVRTKVEKFNNELVNVIRGIIKCCL